MADLEVPNERVLAAVLENRVAEVGIAVLDLDTVVLSLLQLVEQSRSYPITLGQLQAHGPGRVVVCSSAQSGAMLGVNARVGSLYELVPAPRGSFDDVKGQLKIEAAADAASSELLSSSSVKHSLYLALGAAGAPRQAGLVSRPPLRCSSAQALPAGALLQYATEQHSITLLHNSMSVRHVQLTDRLLIDTATATSLELLRPCGSVMGRPKRSCSLFAWLNRTTTAAGARLLKVCTGKVRLPHFRKRQSCLCCRRTSCSLHAV